MGRPVTVLQDDRTDCGPAALLSILRYHGGNAPREEVRVLCGTGPEGTTLAGLEAAAKQLGLQAEGARGDYEALRQVAMPCIAHVVRPDGLEHFLVIHRVGAERVQVMDPAVGRATLSKEEFSTLWRSGVVLLLEPTDGLVCSSSGVRWVPWVWSHLLPEQTWLLQAAFLGMASTLLGLLTAGYVQFLVDRLVPRRDVGLLILSGAALLGIQAVRGGVGFLKQKFLIRLRQNLSNSMLREVMTRLLALPAAFFDRRRAGDVSARIDDAVVIQDAAFMFAGVTVTDALIVIGSITAAFYFAPAVAWIALAAIPLYVFLVGSGTRPIRSEQRLVLDAYGAFRAASVDSILGSAEIRGFGAAAGFAALNDTLHQRFQERLARFQTTRAGVTARSDITGGSLVVTVLLGGGLLVLAGDVRLGSALAVYALLASMLPSLGRLAEMHVAFRQASAAAQRVFDILETNAEQLEPGSAFEFGGGLMLDEVEFGWPGSPPVLAGVSLEIRPDEILVISGANGSGKSTLLRLIQRFYRPTSGRVLLDGRPAEDVPLAAWRQGIAMVPEEVRLFHGTIADNILLGRSGKAFAPLMERMASVGLDKFFSRFPRGLGTMVGESGRRLSSGECKIIGFCRALLDEPSVLLIDEGLNGLDVETGSAVLPLLDAYARDHAVVLVSHEPRHHALGYRSVTLRGGRIATSTAESSGRLRPVLAGVEK